MAVISSEITNDIAQKVTGGLDFAAAEFLRFANVHPIAAILMLLLGANLAKIAKDWS